MSEPKKRGRKPINKIYFGPEQEDAVAKLNSTLRSTKGAAKVSSRELQGLASQMQKLPFHASIGPIFGPCNL